jgi:hypothetical protein
MTPQKVNTPEQKDQARLQQLLQQSLPRTGAQPRANLERDLWPAMLHRMEQRAFAVPWFDWALLAALVVGCVVFPRVIPVLLYHL